MNQLDVVFVRIYLTEGEGRMEKTAAAFAR